MSKLLWKRFLGGFLVPCLRTYSDVCLSVFGVPMRRRWKRARILLLLWGLLCRPNFVSDVYMASRNNGTCQDSKCRASVVSPRLQIMAHLVSSPTLARGSNCGQKIAERL